MTAPKKKQKRKNVKGYAIIRNGKITLLHRWFNVAPKRVLTVTDKGAWTPIVISWEE